MNRATVVRSVAAIALVVATIGLIAMRARLDQAHVALVYLLVVLGGSAAGGRVLGIVLSAAAFVAFNFFFVPPFHTLGVANPFDWLVLAAFLVAGIAAAQLVDQARRREAEVGRLATHADALREADRMKDALLASVSHDLRTPLTTIKALAHEIGHTGDERAIVIEEEADRLTRFVGDLLDLSRLSAGSIPLAVAINAAEDVMGAALQRVSGMASGREIRASLDPTEPVLVGRFDFAHALRILVNLLENALKYAPASQPIDFTVQRVGDALEFAIADRGPGVSDDEAGRLFEPFHRPPNAAPDVGGTGLGLAIARGLAEAQGGELTYAARDGGGSVFRLRLPAADLAELS